MPKRIPKDEKPFRPVENALVSRLLEPGGGGEATATATEPEKATEKEPESPPAAAAVEPAAPIVERTEDNLVHMPQKPAAPAREPRARAPQAPAAEPTVHQRRKPQERFYLSASEKAQLNMLVAELSEALGTTVKASNIHRALHVLCRNARSQIQQRSEHASGTLFRPSNENHVAMAEFEYRLGKILSAALREAPPLREGDGLS